MAVYYASKAYVLSFSEAMRAELAPLRRAGDGGVSWPGAVGVSGARRLCARIRLGDPQCRRRPTSRRQAYGGLMANKRAVLPGLGIKIVPFLLRLFPRSFILAAVGRFQLRKR